ncbi:hypothetical protein ZWY2020_048380 [Hordeum vulgare]|nr:hypothetical protein ZWY2020_048380 [Hordeum vulgare]
MATPEIEVDGSPTRQNPLTGAKKTPLSNGVPRSAGSVEGAGTKPRTTRSGTGGGAGMVGIALPDLVMDGSTWGTMLTAQTPGPCPSSGPRPPSGSGWWRCAFRRGSADDAAVGEAEPS